MGVFLPNSGRLREDEKAWSLREEDELTYDGKRLVRMQHIRVRRDGRLMDFAVEMGPSANYTNAGFELVLLGEHSVGEALEMAEKCRLDTGLGQAMDDHLQEVNVVALMQMRAEMINVYRRRNQRTVANIREFST